MMMTPTLRMAGGQFPCQIDEAENKSLSASDAILEVNGGGAQDGILDCTHTSRAPRL